MKTFFTAIAKFFEKNGLIKLVLAFILLTISVLVVKNNSPSLGAEIFKVIGMISAVYLGLAFLIFLIVGLINTIFKK